MNKKIGILTLSLVVAGAFQASGNITWFSSGAAGPAPGSGDESSVSTNGTLVYAYNLGATEALTANTVPFEGTGTGGLASIGEGNITFDPVDNGLDADFNNLTSNLGTLLDSARWALPDGETVTLNNLASNQTYMVQIYSSETRANRNKNLLLDGTYDAGYTGDDNDGTGRYAIGIFTADAAGKASFHYDYAVGESGNANLNIIQVRAISNDENLPPVASPQDVTTLPETPVEITLAGIDPEGGSLIYTLESQPVNGTLDGATNVWTYTPGNGYMGADSFTFSVSDGAANSAPATVSISVTNQIPTAIAQNVQTVPNTELTITLTGSDPDSGPSNLTYTVDDSLLVGELTGTAPNLTYTPAVDYAGTDSFTFFVNDGLDDSAPATVTIAVTNYPPTADQISVTTPENTDVAITLSGSDPEGSDLTYTVVSQPTHGTLTTDIALPNLIYHPDTGFAGADSFTYTVSDGEFDSVPATVSIGVLGATEEVLYLDTFDGDGLAENTGIGGGAGYGDLYRSSWEDTGLGLQYDTRRNHAATRGVAYSLNTFPATNGFELTVNYNCSQVTDNSDNQFSFGLIRDDLDVSTYGFAGELNPFGVWTQSNLYSVGINVMADTGVVDSGIYANSGDTTELLAAGVTVAGTDVTILMRVEDNGAGGADVSWSVDGVDQSSGTITEFDFTKSYAFLAFASDQEVEPIINSVKLNAAAEKAIEPPVISSVMTSDGMVLSWDGNVTFDVLTSTSLVLPNWSVAVEDAISPVTNAVGSEAQLFYMLRK